MRSNEYKSKMHLENSFSQLDKISGVTGKTIMHKLARIQREHESRGILINYLKYELSAERLIKSKKSSPLYACTRLLCIRNHIAIWNAKWFRNMRIHKAAELIFFSWFIWHKSATASHARKHSKMSSFINVQYKARYSNRNINLK